METSINLLAFMMNHPNCTKLLDINHVDHNSKTALSYAAGNENYKMVKLFLKRTDIDIHPYHKFKPKGYVSTNICEYFVDPLMSSVRNGNKYLVKLFLDHYNSKDKILLSDNKIYGIPLFPQILHFSNGKRREIFDLFCNCKTINFTYNLTQLGNMITTDHLQKDLEFLINKDNFQITEEEIYEEDGNPLVGILQKNMYKLYNFDKYLKIFDYPKISDHFDFHRKMKNGITYLEYLIKLSFASSRLFNNFLIFLKNEKVNSKINYDLVYYKKESDPDHYPDSWRIHEMPYVINWDGGEIRATDAVTLIKILQENFEKFKK